MLDSGEMQTTTKIMPSTDIDTIWYVLVEPFRRVLYLGPGFISNATPHLKGVYFSVHSRIIDYEGFVALFLMAMRMDCCHLVYVRFV